MKREAPFKFAIRNMGPQRGVHVYLSPTEVSMQHEDILVMTLHPRVANTPGMEELTIQFVKDMGRLFIEDVIGPNAVDSMITREPPKAN